MNSTELLEQRIKDLKEQNYFLKEQFNSVIHSQITTNLVEIKEHEQAIKILLDNQRM